MINNYNISSPSVEAQRSFSKELSKLRRNQQILTILVLLFVTMAVWILVSLASSQRTSKITPEVKQMALPLTPTLDTTAIDKLESKVTYTEEELSTFPINVIYTDPRSQQETVVPLGTTVVLQPSPTPRVATSSSQLQQVIATPRPTPTPDQTELTQ